MAGKIEKGRINSLDADKHTAKVSLHSGLITYDVVIPFYLRKESGNLKKDDEVIVVTFDDNTGMILHRMDGDWEYKTIKSLEVHGDFAVKKNENSEDDGKLGKITADDEAVIAKDITSSDGDVIAGITLKTHVHPYSWTDPAGSGDTGVGK